MIRALVCDWCWVRVEGGEGECCMRCGLVRYCSSSCRGAAWREHEDQCDQTRRERHCSDVVRLIARICRKVNN